MERPPNLLAGWVLHATTKVDLLGLLHISSSLNHLSPGEPKGTTAWGDDNSLFKQFLRAPKMTVSLLFETNKRLRQPSQPLSDILLNRSGLERV